MALLKEIAPSVQQVADAIAIAVGVEVEIVDHQLTVIGGTGIYAGRIGEKEESGELSGDLLYARMLRKGQTEYIEDTEKHQYYGEHTGELAEISTPIRTPDDAIIGIIALVAVSDAQKAVLIDGKRRMVSFVEKMAELLAAKAVQKAALSASELARSELSTVLETAHEGIVSIDERGMIRHCNSRAQGLLATTREDLIGSHISSHMPKSTALEVLRTGTGYTEMEELYNSKRGAFHFIVSVRPFFRDGQIAGAVISFRDIAEAEQLVYNMNTRALKYTFDDIIGSSEALRRVKQQALMTARSNSTVLITGESGTGKEMFAKAIHYASARQQGPFITVNCGAIPENLLESELFGYEKGAFTGAASAGKKGKFELASGGTIFLDEIGDLPLPLQVKLLHVLQSMRFERVGGSRTIIADVRVIAATNRDLDAMIQQGSFREDLYYRLSVIPMMIPPLRERIADIRVLMLHFLKKYNTFMDRKITSFSNEVESYYQAYHWPGNVRELENAVEYGVNMAYGDQIGMDAVPPRMLRNTSTSLDVRDSDLTLAEQIRAYEKEILLRKLKKHGSGGSAKDLIAKELGLSRATLYRKLAEMGLS